MMTFESEHFCKLDGGRKEMEWEFEISGSELHLNLVLNISLLSHAFTQIKSMSVKMSTLLHVVFLSQRFSNLYKFFSSNLSVFFWSKTVNPQRK